MLPDDSHLAANRIRRYDPNPISRRVHRKRQRLPSNGPIESAPAPTLTTNRTISCLGAPDRVLPFPADRASTGAAGLIRALFQLGTIRPPCTHYRWRRALISKCCPSKLLRSWPDLARTGAFAPAICRQCLLSGQLLETGGRNV